jgi:hypothetical protein
LKTIFLWLSLLFGVISSAQSGLGFAVDCEVLFDTGKSSLAPAQKKRVQEYCNTSARHFTETIGIIGYSDLAGTDQINDTLSLNRAKALRDYIHEFLPLQKIEVYIGDRNEFHLSLPQDQQRRAFIIRGAVCGTRENPLKYYAPRVPQLYVEPNFLVSSSNYAQNGKEIRVTTYDNAKEMIAFGINAVDSANVVLHALWIARICIDSPWKAPKGYKVYVPVKYTYDNGLKVYLRRSDFGAWQETDIKIKTEGKNYVFELEERDDCVSFCLGKPAGKKKKNNKVIEPAYKTVYISTFKPLHFKDITVAGKYNSLSYSAAVTDTLMAFTLPEGVSANQMLLEGIYEDDKTVSVSMSKLSYSKDKDGNDRYHIPEEALQDRPVKKKKGFWKWLKNLFS